MSQNVAQNFTAAILMRHPAHWRRPSEAVLDQLSGGLHEKTLVVTSSLSL